MVCVCEFLPPQLADGTVDAVVSTLVLCSVHDVAKSVAEVHRVLRPGGSFYFIEHVAASDEHPVLQWTQWFVTVTRLWGLFGDGCHVDRATHDVITSFPWRSVQLHHDMTMAGVAPVSPHIHGVAVKE